MRRTTASQRLEARIRQKPEQAARTEREKLPGPGPRPEPTLVMRDRGQYGRYGDGGNADGEGTDAPDDALPVMGQGLSESAMGGQSAADQQVVISPDEMIQKKDELTATEKEQIFNILMKKLPQSEMQKISAAMEDGLTEQELSTIEDTISKYLTKEEYAALSKLLEQ